MIEAMGSLKVVNTPVVEGSKSSTRPRQGAGQPEVSKRVEANAKPADAEPIKIEKVAALAEELNSALGAAVNGDVSVSVDDTTGMIVVRIKDSDTGEIMRQIPPQQLLDADVNMDKIIGLLGEQFL